MRILIINGANLGSLGKREPHIYGTETLSDICKQIESFAKGHSVEFFHSNSEGEIIDAIEDFDGDAIIINAGAHTHYSYAIADALKAKTCKKIEVHLSNVHAREEFRRHSVIAPFCDGVICGFGRLSYLLAVTAVLEG